MGPQQQKESAAWTILRDWTFEFRNDRQKREIFDENGYSTGGGNARACDFSLQCRRSRRFSFDTMV